MACSHGHSLGSIGTWMLVNSDLHQDIHFQSRYSSFNASFPSSLSYSLILLHTALLGSGTPADPRARNTAPDRHIIMLVPFIAADLQMLALGIVMSVLLRSCISKGRGSMYQHHICNSFVASGFPRFLRSPASHQPNGTTVQMTGL